MRPPVCDCPTCRRATAAWAPLTGARWRLAVLTLVVALVLTGAWSQRAAGASSPSTARCAWLTPYLADAGLPVGTFLRIAWRESGCARTGVRVADGDDLSSSRFGLNFRTAGLRRTWAHWCGATHWTQPGASVELDVACVAAAYTHMGLRPWR